MSRRIFLFSSESSDYKENYSAFVFLGHNTKLGPLGAVSTETWTFFLNYKTSLALIDRCLKSNFVWNVFKLFSYFIARKCWKQMYFFLLFYVSVALDRSTRRKTLRSSGNSDQNETLLLIRQDYLSLWKQDAVWTKKLLCR